MLGDRIQLNLSGLGINGYRKFFILSGGVLVSLLLLYLFFLKDRVAFLKDLYQEGVSLQRKHTVLYTQVVNLEREAERFSERKKRYKKRINKRYSASKKSIAEKISSIALEQNIKDLELYFEGPHRPNKNNLRFYLSASGSGKRLVLFLDEVIQKNNFITFSQLSLTKKDDNQDELKADGVIANDKNRGAFDGEKN